MNIKKAQMRQNQKITFDGVGDEKVKIVSEALIDNYNRQKFK